MPWAMGGESVGFARVCDGALGRGAYVVEERGGGQSRGDGGSE